MAKFESRPGTGKYEDLYIDGHKVLKAWESFSGWYWFATEKGDKQDSVFPEPILGAIHDPEWGYVLKDDQIWFGLVQGFEEEWGSWSEGELKALMAKNKVWLIKPQDLPYSGRRNTVSYMEQAGLSSMEKSHLEQPRSYPPHGYIERPPLGRPLEKQALAKLMLSGTCMALLGMEKGWLKMKLCGFDGGTAKGQFEVKMIDEFKWEDTRHRRHQHLDPDIFEEKVFYVYPTDFIELIRQWGWYGAGEKAMLKQDWDIEGDLVLFIHEGCPTCHIIQEAFQEFIDDGILHVKDIANDPEALKYFEALGFKKVPTFIMIVDGQFLEARLVQS